MRWFKKKPRKFYFSFKMIKKDKYLGGYGLNAEYETRYIEESQYIIKMNELCNKYNCHIEEVSSSCGCLNFTLEENSFDFCDFLVLINDYIDYFGEWIEKINF